MLSFLELATLGLARFRNVRYSFELLLLLGRANLLNNQTIKRDDRAKIGGLYLNRNVEHLLGGVSYSVWAG